METSLSRFCCILALAVFFCFGLFCWGVFSKCRSLGVGQGWLALMRVKVLNSFCRSSRISLLDVSDVDDALKIYERVNESTMTT